MNKQLSATVSCLLALSFASMATPPSAEALRSLHSGMSAPQFSVRAVTGETRSSEDLKGEKLTVVVFWSSWSAKSIDLLARMQALYRQYGGRGLSVVAVNVDEQKPTEAALEEITALQRKLGLAYPLLVDDGLEVFERYGVIAVPTTVVIDPDRAISYELAGYPLVRREAMMDYISSVMENAGVTPASSGN